MLFRSMLWAMLQKIHCNQSGCIGPRCMDSTAYNRDPLRHNAWNALHSMTLHGIHFVQSGCFGPCCIKSTAFNHAAWNPLHSIGMQFTTLNGVHCIQSCCMESPAFNRDALGHASKKSTSFNRDALGLASWTPVHRVGIHCTTMHGILCIQ